MMIIIVVGILPALVLSLLLLPALVAAAYAQTMEELLSQAEEWEAQKSANRTGMPVMNQTQITAQRQEIERLMAEDPTFKNYELIFADCTNNMAFGNGTMSHFQCISTFQEAKDKYCGLEAYHQTKCEYITFTSDMYSTFTALGK